MKAISESKKIVVFVVLATGFLAYSFFLYANPPADTSYHDVSVAKGKVAWQKYNCNACHQVYGLGGYLGPDVTNVYSKGPGYIKAFLQNGTGIMPDFELSEEEMNNLVEYFKHLDQSGKADPRTFKILPDGSIAQ